MKKIKVKSVKVGDTVLYNLWGYFPRTAVVKSITTTRNVLGREVKEDVQGLYAIPKDGNAVLTMNDSHTCYLHEIVKIVER